MGRSGSCGVVRPIISDFHSDDPGSNPGTSTQWPVLECVRHSKMTLCSKKFRPSTPATIPPTPHGAFARTLKIRHRLMRGTDKASHGPVEQRLS